MRGSSKRRHAVQRRVARADGGAWRALSPEGAEVVQERVAAPQRCAKSTSIRACSWR